jgi:hypothetical protein
VSGKLKLLYVSAHSVLEYYELKMFASIGVDLFALGSYTNPHAPADTKRPALPQIPRKPELESCLRGDDREDLPQELVRWADVILYAGLPDKWMIPNWERIKHKRVIWRTIGQSNPELELAIKPYRDIGGLQIVRYSPAEQRFFGPLGAWAGQDALIRFGLDPEEFSGWTGSNVMVGQVSQHSPEPHGRDPFTNWQWFERATAGLPRSFAGPHSEKVGGLGELSYDAMRQYLRELRCYCYTGTVPASYTLSGIETMLTGCPMVSITKDYNWAGPDLFEMDEIALWSYKDPMDANAMIRRLLEDYELARVASIQQRERAVELFGVDRIAEQWRSFLYG